MLSAYYRSHDENEYKAFHNIGLTKSPKVQISLDIISIVRQFRAFLFKGDFY